MKSCAKCNQAKPLSDFGKRSRSPDGLHPRCRKCVSDDSRDTEPATLRIDRRR